MSTMESSVIGEHKPSTIASGHKTGRWRIAWCHTGDSGGSKRAACEMVRELASRGHVIDQYIIRIGEPNFSHWPMDPYVRKSYRYIVPGRTIALRPHLVHVYVNLAQQMLAQRSLSATLDGLVADLQSRGYDYVHIDHCAPSYTVGLSSKLALPSVVYSHEASGARYHSARLNANMTRNSKVRSLYEWACALPTRTWSKLKERRDIEGLRAASLILTNSHYSREALFHRAGCWSAVCRYGVDIATFRPLGYQAQPVILSAGRIVEAKQHHLVLQAVALLSPNHRPRVVIATPETITHQEDPLYMAWLVELAREAGVSLEITRNPSEHELVELYNRASMLVFVPIMEPFGLVAIEAMACGTPVVGIREAGVRESVLDGETGILVERDPQALANAIDRLARDRELRTQQGQQAAEYVRNEWTWPRTIDCYENQVVRMLANRRVAPR